MKIAVVGATGRTGRLVVDLALAAGHTVDHAQTTPGQARVDAQHPHSLPQMPRDRIAHAIPLA